MKKIEIIIRREKVDEVKKKLYEMGMATKEIAQVVGYPVEEVEEWLGLV